MNNYTMILISGKQGSGKTALANLLKEKLVSTNSAAEIINFADTIYEMHDAVREILHRKSTRRDMIAENEGVK